jgi:hypothetical protein
MGDGDYEKLTPQAIDSVSAAAGGEGGQADCPGARSVHRHRPGRSTTIFTSPVPLGGTDVCRSEQSQPRAAKCAATEATLGSQPCHGRFLHQHQQRRSSMPDRVRDEEVGTDPDAGGDYSAAREVQNSTGWDAPSCTSSVAARSSSSTALSGVVARTSPRSCTVSIPSWSMTC